MVKPLPRQYAWLLKEPGPRIFLEMLKLHGVLEKQGPSNNPIILSWADRVGLGHIYNNDAIAWCGLVISFAAAQAGWDYSPRGNALWARNWLAWGNAAITPMLGDILVFPRGKGGHVAMYVGEDKTHFHILGGNQDNQVNIKRKPKSMLIAARRCPWRVEQPSNVRRILLEARGPVSIEES